MANTKNKSADGNVRTLKVYEKITSQQSRRYYWKIYIAHCPEIRLMGKWLQQCGFRAGQHIEVVQERNKLTITPAWFEQDD